MANTKKSDTEKMKTIYKVDDPKHFMRIVGWNGRRFKIVSEHTNGDPCGFNYKCCVSIMTPEGTWVHLEDNRSLQITEWHNQYILDKDDPRVQSANLRAYIAFTEYIRSVY